MALQHFQVLIPDYPFHTLALLADAAEAGQ
jgi:hypothetical protein